MALNNGSLTETMQFNSRLQPTQIAAGNLLSLSFEYGAINNGNIKDQTISRPSVSFNATQSYTYDGVNRLDLASESGSAWSRDYAYDAYGNRAATGTGITGGSPTPQSTGDFNLLNQISVASYDDAGNMQALAGIGTMAYDANNKMTAFDNANPNLAGAGVYFYDGEGNRVKRTMTDPSGTTTTLFVYDAMGKLAAEYSDQPPTGAGETLYRTTDYLGSTRLVTNAAGQIPQGGCSDYFPFGQRIDSGIGSRNTIGCYDGVSPLRQRFTAKERDEESGLDYFLARYYSSSLGRFTSPDSTAYSSLRLPGSWNLYGYTLNNPLRFNDPSRHVVELASCTSVENCQQELAAVQGALANKEAASRLTVQEVKGERTLVDRLLGREAKSKFTVGIRGDVAEFRGLSANANRIGALIASESLVVGFSLRNTRSTTGGGQRDVAGGFSALPSQGFSQPHVYVRADGNTASFDSDTRGILGGVPGTIPGASFQETVAHEFGHTFGELIQGHPAGSNENKREAVRSENEVRRTDPQRGFKIRHGTEVLRPGDLP